MRVDFETPLSKALGVSGTGKEGIIGKVQELMDAGKVAEIESALLRLDGPIQQEARGFLAVVFDLGGKE